jgi:hypothetical protein
MTLTQIYKTKTIQISDIKLKHHWLDVLPPNPLVRIVRLYDIEKYLSDSPDLEIYLQSSPVSFMYPMFFFKTLFGFGFRSIADKEFTVKLLYPMLSYTPTNTMMNLSKCIQPKGLVLVEGVSDAEAVSKYYPWVISVMGNKVKNLMQGLLPYYTKRVYLMFDNDSAGNEGANCSQIALTKKNIVTKILKYPVGCPFKDPAEIVGKGHSDIITNMLKDVL